MRRARTAREAEIAVERGFSMALAVKKPIRLCFNAGSPSSGASGESKIPGQGFGEIAGTCKVPIKTQTYWLIAIHERPGGVACATPPGRSTATTMRLPQRLPRNPRQPRALRIRRLPPCPRQARCLRPQAPCESSRRQRFRRWQPRSPPRSPPRCPRNPRQPRARQRPRSPPPCPARSRRRRPRRARRRPQPRTARRRVRALAATSSSASTPPRTRSG